MNAHGANNMVFRVVADACPMTGVSFDAAAQQADSALNSVRAGLLKIGVEIRGVDLVQDLAAA